MIVSRLNLWVKTRHIAPDLGNILEAYGTRPFKYKIGLGRERSAGSGLIRDASKNPGQGNHFRGLYEVVKVCCVV